MIRNVKSEDIPEICTIYNYYITETIISFEMEPVSEQEMRRRIKQKSELYPWLVYEDQGKIDGYAYACEWKEREGYRHTAESSIYLLADSAGKGIGTRLYQALIDELRKLDIHSVIGGIALPNPGSVALHEKLGFSKVAHFKEVGRKMDRWIDVGYWELVL